jgi:AraC-like DNA-binding protein
MSIRLGRSAALTGYVDLAIAIGADPHQLVAAEGLPIACLTEPDLRISSDAVSRLIEATARRPGGEDFALCLAETRRLSNLGPLGLVAREQATLRAAIETLIRYSWLQNDAVRLRMEDAGAVSILRVALAFDLPAGRQVTELSVAILIGALRSLVGEQWRPQAVAFEHAAPANLAAHRRVLGVTPMFDHDFTGVVLLSSELDRPLRAADPVIARQLQGYIENFAERRRADPVAEARALLVALLPTGAASVERLAAYMGVSRRTLHRQLARQGLTFTELLLEVRRRQLGAYVAAGTRSLTEIAELLGYSCLSTFSRWRRAQGLQSRTNSGTGGETGGPRPTQRQRRSSNL